MKTEIEAAFKDLKETREKLMVASLKEFNIKSNLKGMIHALYIGDRIDGKNAELREAQVYELTLGKQLQYRQAGTEKAEALLQLEIAQDKVKMLEMILKVSELEI